MASGEKAAYVAAKHGIVGLTKVVAIETANDGVTCNAICPGWVLTPLVQQQIDARAKAAGKSVTSEASALLSEKQPMHQFTTPENIGALAVFLARRRRRDHHRLGLLDRRRLDRAVKSDRRSFFEDRLRRPPGHDGESAFAMIEFLSRAFGGDKPGKPKAGKRINLALQGGGAHGAFTWGVLDHLLEDGRRRSKAFPAPRPAR